MFEVVVLDREILALVVGVARAGGVLGDFGVAASNKATAVLGVGLALQSAVIINGGLADVLVLAEELSVLDVGLVSKNKQSQSEEQEGQDRHDREADEPPVWLNAFLLRFYAERTECLFSHHAHADLAIFSTQTPFSRSDDCDSGHGS